MIYNKDGSDLCPVPIVCSSHAEAAFAKFGKSWSDADRDEAMEQIRVQLPSNPPPLYESIGFPNLKFDRYLELYLAALQEQQQVSARLAPNCYSGIGGGFLTE